MSYIVGGENTWCVLIIAWGGWGHGEATSTHKLSVLNDILFVCAHNVSPHPPQYILREKEREFS